MPRRPPNRGQEWQLQQKPLVITDMRRPFYINPSNNGLGQPVRRRPKPLAVARVKRSTANPAGGGTSSTGTVLPVVLKVTDG